MSGYMPAVSVSKYLHKTIETFWNAKVESAKGLQSTHCLMCVFIVLTIHKSSVCDCWWEPFLQDLQMLVQLWNVSEMHVHVEM